MILTDEEIRFIEAVLDRDTSHDDSFPLWEAFRDLRKRLNLAPLSQ